MEKSVGFILMLDVSYSMNQDIPQVKINANSFLGEGITGDQFAVNAFSDNAKWVYPTSSQADIAAVSDETILAARAKIDKLYALNMTNISDAIRLGNGMIAKATTDIKAFVLLSDGKHNMGNPYPDEVLGNEPPIYVAGMGYCVERNFTSMIAKNPLSSFRYKPRSYEMMLLFNQIRADASDGALAANMLHDVGGSYYTLDNFNIASSSNAQICVTWTDKSFIYTSGTPQGHRVYVALIDPDNKRQSVKPTFDGEGFCIFHLKNAKAGQWKVLTEFSTPDTFKTTVGVIDRSPSVKTELDAPRTAKLGEPIDVGISVADYMGTCENVTIGAHTTKYEPVPREGQEAENTEAGEAPMDFAVNQTDTRQLLSAEYGEHTITLDDTARPGIYNLEIAVEGSDRKSGEKFTQIKTVSIIVE